MTTAKEKDSLLRIVYDLKLKYNTVYGYDTDVESLQKASSLPGTTFNVAFQEVESDNYLSTVGNDGNGMIPLIITDLGYIFSRKGGYRGKERRQRLKKTKGDIIKYIIPFLALIISVVAMINQYSSNKDNNYQQKTLDSLSKKVYTLDGCISDCRLMWLA